MKSIRNLLITAFLSLFLTFNAFAAANPLLGYTHLLHSPVTVPAGSVFLGSTTGVGITDSLQLQTNVVRDLYRIYNFTATYNLVDFPGFAIGLNLSYQYVNLRHISDYNPELRLSSWMPGAVIGAEVMPFVAVFFGGNFNISNFDLPNVGVESSGIIQGGQIETDIAWAYHPDDMNLGNVIAGGISYNSTYKFYGVGLSHYWNGFHIGFHYFPNAKKTKVLPILTAGISFDF